MPASGEVYQAAARDHNPLHTRAPAARGSRAKHTMRHCLAILIVLIALAARASAAADTVQVDAVALFKDKAVLVINGVRRSLSVGATSPEGVRLIGANSEQAEVELAGERLKLRLDGSIVSSFTRGVAARELILAPGDGGHYYVDGTINGTSVAFVIDTGATSVAINKRTAKRIGLAFRVDGEPSQVETASGRVAAYSVTFASVKIRSIELKNVPGVVIDGDFPSVALLGQSFLNRLDMQRAGVMLEIRER